MEQLSSAERLILMAASPGPVSETLSAFQPSKKNMAANGTDAVTVQELGDSATKQSFQVGSG